MEIIENKVNLVFKILGEQLFDVNEKYRLSYHCIIETVEAGVLIYHVMTKEMILLSNNDINELKTNCKSDPSNIILKYLVNNWFLMPVCSCDYKVVDELREAAKIIKKKSNTISLYTIFTTTNCNARCFYCFENGTTKLDMNNETAIDVARFIVKHSGNEKITIRWFGGEPLCNYSVINIITEYLHSQKIEFTSTMVSNGFLFDKKLVKKSRELWNLREVQITLDGTEDVYNKRKAYIYNNVNPFKRVLDNIKLLLDSEIKVVVRLNMDGNNYEDLIQLCNLLSDKFKGEIGFHVYVAILYENVGKTPIHRNNIERAELFELAKKLRKHIKKVGVASKPDFNKVITLNRCMADSSNATTITPLGSLGKCEHFTDKELWGSIYSDEIDYDVIKKWEERMHKERKCETCEVYPECIRLKRCPGLIEICTDNDQELRKEKIRRAMETAYLLWLKKQFFES